MVDHLRWDLRQIFEMALAEGLIQSNPARLMFTPRTAQRSRRRILNWEEARKLLSALDVRERLIAMLAMVAGMRPGEILALQWKHVRPDHVQVRQRIYRGDIDTPKTVNSVRDCALSDELQSMLRDWKATAIDPSQEAWVFPSERLETPVIRDNLWRRNFKPCLDKKGLGWATFQVMRRTHSSLMKDLGVDSKLVADQQGHTLDVNLNVYTRSSVAARKSALDRLENRVFAA